MNTVPTTTSPSISPAPARPEVGRVRRAVRPVGVAALLVAVGFTVLRSNSGGEVAVTVPAEILGAALLFGPVVPRGLRHDSAGGRAFGLGLVGVLMVVPFFWSGLPLLLGSAAALLGEAGRSARTGSRWSVAALVVGLLAVVGYLAVYVLDWIRNPGLSWMS